MYLSNKLAYRPTSCFFRFILCIIPYISLIYNSQHIYHITGPITLSPFDKVTLIYITCGIQFVRIYYQLFLLIIFKVIKISPKLLKLLANDITKYAIIIILKSILIFSQQHRLKYYLHVFLIQLFILTCYMLISIVQNQKVAQVAQIIFLDGFSRIAFFYQITRTFSPNFGMYYFGYNLLILILNQLQGDKKSVLYVKHDIYRIMTVSFVYMLLLSVLQCSLTLFPLFLFSISSFFFFKAITQFNQNLQKQSFRYFILVICIYSFGELVHFYILSKQTVPNI